jgi:[acyl-carrier-protein] S-malonyltransferase
VKAFIFPGQGSQFKGMGHDLYQSHQKAKKLFELANKLLEFDICKIMFEGSEEDLKQTNVTQPAIFIHSIILANCITNLNPDMVAGHSLGEFSALVAAKSLSFEDGLKLVMARAEAMHIACENNDSTMAAIIGLEAHVIEKICNDEKGIVVPANYNSSTQIVISGNKKTIQKICNTLIKLGAKRAIILPVAGAFHSPIMKSAKDSLKNVINSIEFNNPICPIYQNVSASPTIDNNLIKNNLIEQLTKPVKWHQTIENMIRGGATQFIEVGPGNVLIGLNKRINGSIESIKATV